MTEQSQGAVTIRPFLFDDQAEENALWALLEPTFRAGDTYTIDADISREEALAYWTGAPRTVFMVEDDGQILGTYYVTPNQKGGGRHVCNCGFVTGPAARGKGIARMMLAHALETAKSMGFSAMQFNFVVSTNTRAVDIWRRAGFDVVGTLPKAFDHPEHGLVDAYVMYKML